MEHTPEPWKVSGDFIVNNCIEKIASGRGNRNWNRDAKRIVACVNACAGIDPEALIEFIEAAKALREKPVTGDVMRFDHAMIALTKHTPGTPLVVEGEDFLERRKFLRKS